MITLPYGVAAPIPRRRRSFKLFVCLAVAVIGCLAIAITVVVREWRAGEIGAVRARLQGLKGASLLRIDSYQEDSWDPVEALGATVQVAGKAESQFAMPFPRRDWFDSTKHLRISQIGPWRFEIRATRSGRPFGTSCIDIGRKGEFAKLLTQPIRNVQDVVDHFDELVDAVGKLPRTGTLPSNECERYQYTIIRVNEDATK